MRRATFLFVLMTASFSYSCVDYSNSTYIDAHKKAIISTNGNDLLKVRIDGPDSIITYESFTTHKQASIIYFNKINSNFRITVAYDSVDNGYILRLKPKSSYKIYSYSSNLDQGPFCVYFETDKSSNILIK